MSYDIQEKSVEVGQPVELYVLSISNTTYYMTSADQDYVALGVTFTATELSRSQIAISPDERNDIVTLTLPASHPYPKRYVSIIPGQRGVLTIYRVHNTDSAAETQVIYKGLVRSVSFSRDGQEARLAVMPVTAALSRTIPRFVYSGLCNHVLYGPKCKIVEALFRHHNTCTAISANGLDLTITGLSVKGSGWATGGFISVGASDYRLIVAHSSNTISLLIPFPSDLPVLNQTVDVFAGCDHSIATCKTKFNNIVNFGGFAFVPKRNIFATGLQ